MKRLLFVFFVLALHAGISSNASAALLFRGFGTIVGGGSNQYQLFYDDLLNITWLDYTKSRDSWYDQRAWADNLGVKFGEQTFNDWRLPQTLPVDGSEYDYNRSYDGSTDNGFAISAPGSAYPGSKASEMAHLYYTTMGLLGRRDFNGDNRPDFQLPNIIYFENLEVSDFWSGSESLLDSDYAWAFYLDRGFQYSGVKTYTHYALAVYPGDVQVVPIPAAFYLFGSGLIGLAGIRKKFKG